MYVVSDEPVGPLMYCDIAFGCAGSASSRLQISLAATFTC